MPTTPAAADVLDREFLAMRAKLIVLAAALDRIGRAEGDVSNDTRLAMIRESLDVLGSDANNRAEQIQMLFSLPYQEGWQEEVETS